MTERRSIAVLVHKQIVLGPCERAALRAGLALSETLKAELCAIELGGDRALLLARRLGYDRLIAVGEPALAERLDPIGAARILAEVCEHVGARIVLCGDRSLSAAGIIGPAVAEAMDLPHLTGVIDIQRAGPRVELVQMDGDGMRQRFRARREFVACVSQFPRGARGRRTTRSTPERLELSDLSIDRTELDFRSSLQGAIHPESAAGAVVACEADELVARLREDRFLAEAIWRS